VTGYLAGGVANWHAAGRQVGTIPQWPVDELRSQSEEDPRLQVVDVRRPGEFAAGRVPGARHIPLDRLERECGALDRSRPLAVVCQSGYRSSTACSLLRRNGFADVRNVAGGTSAWVAAGFEVDRS